MNEYTYDDLVMAIDQWEYKNGDIPLRYPTIAEIKHCFGLDLSHIDSFGDQQIAAFRLNKRVMYKEIAKWSDYEDNLDFQHWNLFYWLGESNQQIPIASLNTSYSMGLMSHNDVQLLNPDAFRDAIAYLALLSLTSEYNGYCQDVRAGEWDVHINDAQYRNF